MQVTTGRGGTLLKGGSGQNRRKVSWVLHISTLNEVFSLFIPTQFSRVQILLVLFKIPP